jgi:hypothetical protein
VGYYQSTRRINPEEYAIQQQQQQQQQQHQQQQQQQQTLDNFYRSYISL